jgi:hypothetical protein
MDKEGSMQCLMPNGDVLSVRYDGRFMQIRVVALVDDCERTVFNRSFNNTDLTGDPVFRSARPACEEGLPAQHPYFRSDE